MKESTAWLLTNAMEDVVKIGTGKSLRLQNINMPVAGKTGSTSDYYDLWFSGYSPYYTASIWSGYDNNRYQSDRSYNRVIWRTIMEQIHIQKELETKSFTMPDSIVQLMFVLNQVSLLLMDYATNTLEAIQVQLNALQREQNQLNFAMFI